MFTLILVRICTLVFASSAAFSASNAQDARLSERKSAPSAAPSPTPSRLSVVSYNIRGLPGIIAGKQYSTDRYPLIGKLLADRRERALDADIVLLQEAFSGNVKTLLEKAAYPHLAEGPVSSFFLTLDSGLFILSKYPIVETASQAFGSKLCASWDCMAKKGVQLARIAVPGLTLPVEIYNTHMQAGRADTQIRLEQTRVLLEFFKKHHRPGSPVIYAGDFNFRPGLKQPSFELFERTLMQNSPQLAHAGKYCLENRCTQSPDESWQGVWQSAVDHQFYSAHFKPLRFERGYREPVEGLKLSDHLSVDVVYEIVQR